MVKILKGIYSDISLGPLLGFKGGTALYLVKKFALWQPAAREEICLMFGLCWKKGAVLKKIRSYPQIKLDRDLARFLPRSQRNITSMLKARLEEKFG